VRTAAFDSFSKAFRNLTPELQDHTRKALARFRDNPDHLSLNIKNMKGRASIWEGRITDAYRFTFYHETDSKTGERIYVLRNIGPHSILDTNP